MRAAGRRTLIGPVVLVVVAAAWGCGGCAMYTRVGERYTADRTPLTVSLPRGWLHYTPARHAYVLTRDGLRLERIEIAVRRYDEKLPDTDRRFRADMMPLEAAELTLGLLEGREDVKQFELDKIDAIQIAGRDGYRAEGSFLDSRGLPLRLVQCGVLLPDAVCELRYIAERSTYFEKHRGDFERLVASATMTGGR